MTLATNTVVSTPSALLGVREIHVVAELGDRRGFEIEDGLDRAESLGVRVHR